MTEIENGIVAVVDLLGTKGIWRYSDPQKHIENIKDFENGINEKVKPVFNGLGKPNGKNHMISREGIFDMTTFSDTIIFTYFFPKYSFHVPEYESIHRILNMFMVFSAEFVSYAIRRGLFYRGSISYGPIYKDGTDIIGQAIDDAAQFADKANWIGISCTPSTSYLYEGSIGQMNKNQDTIKYNVPHKNTSMDLVCPNWPMLFKKQSKQDTNPRDDLLLSFAKNYISEEAQIKYKNTIDFYDYCINNNAS
ncbi:MAG: hypothetical protein KA140_07020 [Caldisericia bacterium]|nr:hypothetical protein [Caldisericia bacterium]